MLKLVVNSGLFSGAFAGLQTNVYSTTTQRETIESLTYKPPTPGEKYCYALALSGGGAFGTYETGVIWGLVHYGNPDDYRYDVFTGVSAGALNAGMMSVFPKGQEVEMTEAISYQETITTYNKTMAFWPGPLHGIVEGVLHHQGLVDYTPFQDYYNEWLQDYERIEKKLIISAADLEDGSYVEFTEDIGIENLATVVKASSSIPFLFEPTRFDGHMLMDGGTIWNINIDGAINRCLEEVDDEAHVILDIVICEHMEFQPLNSTGKTISNIMRNRQIGKYYGTMNDIIEQARGRPDVSYRHFFAPSEDMGGIKGEIDFRNSTTFQYQLLGRKDAAEALDHKPENGFAPHSFEQMFADFGHHIEQPWNSRKK